MKAKPNLDFLRAIAILLVVLDHTLLAQHIMTLGHWQSEWIGVMGVCWFFVHTSLVLMWSLQRKPHTLDFYIRRIFRIYPLAIAAILVTVLVHAPIGGSPNHFFTYYPASPLQITADILLIQNLILSNPFLGVMWSLPLEVDMYILLPALFFFVRRNFSLWPLLAFWMLAVGVARPQVIWGNIFITVVPCFLPGIMAYVLFQRTHPRLPAWLFPVFLFSILGAFMVDPGVKHQWPACLVLGLGLPFFRQISAAPLIRVSHEVAKYSYGIYLTHSFGLVIGFYLLRGRPVWLQIFSTLLSTAVFSVIAYHALEKPLIDVGARLALRAEKRYEQRVLAEVL